MSDNVETADAPRTIEVKKSGDRITAAVERAAAKSATPEAPEAASAPGAASAPAEAQKTPAEGQDATAPEADAAEQDPAAKKASARFAEIARRESALTKREAALRASERELQEFRRARDGAKTNPRDALKALGVSISDLVEFEIRDGAPETVESRVARLEQEKKDEAAAQAKAKEDAARRQVEATFAAVRADIRKHVDAAPEKYELIALEGAHDEVFNLIDGMYAQTLQEADAGKRDAPVLLSIEQASDMIEAELYERAKKVAAAKKLAPPPAPKVEEPAAPAKRPAPTLSSRTAPTGASRANPATKASKAERLRRIESMLKFKD